MYIKKLILIVSILFFSIGCEEAKEQQDLPEFEFTSLLKKRNVNLTNRLGESIMIQRKSDTLKYAITFDRQSKFNYITNQSGDTIFSGTVSKINRIYILNSHLKNGNFRISPIRFTDSTITGFDQRYYQNLALHEIIELDNYSILKQDTTNQLILTVDKKNGKKLFNTVLDSLPVERVVIQEDLREILESKTYDIKDSTNHSITERTIINEVYPNPVQTILSIRTTNSVQSFDYRLVDMNGRTFRSGVFLENGGEIDCTDLITGVYVLIIPKTKESFKIMKN